MLLLGVADVAASKRFYVDRGLAVAKSFGRKYVEFAAASGPVKLALYRRRALAKDAGVSPDGTGSHRLIIGGDAGPSPTRTGSPGRPSNETIRPSTDSSLTIRERPYQASLPLAHRQPARTGTAWLASSAPAKVPRAHAMRP